MQCASSTAMSFTPRENRYSLKILVSSRSGETYRNLQLLFPAVSRVFSTSFLVMPEWMKNEVIPFLLRFSTWSFINAISGVITRHRPSIAIAGTWKQIDFPPPVGSRARQSFLLSTVLIMSSCKGRNPAKPQYSFTIECIDFIILLSSHTILLNLPQVPHRSIPLPVPQTLVLANQKQLPV